MNSGTIGRPRYIVSMSEQRASNSRTRPIGGDLWGAQEAGPNTLLSGFARGPMQRGKPGPRETGAPAQTAKAKNSPLDSKPRLPDVEFTVIQSAAKAACGASHPMKMIRVRPRVAQNPQRRDGPVGAVAGVVMTGGAATATGGPGKSASGSRGLLESQDGLL